MDTAADRCLGPIIGASKTLVTAYESAAVPLMETQQQSLDSVKWILNRCFSYGRAFIIGRWSEQFGITEMNLKTASRPEAAPHIDRVGLTGLFVLLKRTDNLLRGAVNAFTGDCGTTRNPLTGEIGIGVAEVARALKAKGMPWLLVGDENYGEGSSREHAAMSPRLLGAAAVIVHSFARTHETNLKKQGVLPLTFANPANYDDVQAADLLSLSGLTTLAPGHSLTLILHHPDGTEKKIELNHSLNVQQISWFKAGSALNMLGRLG